MPRPTQRLFLVGFAGTGKTTLGCYVAKRLGWQWIDLDAAIEHHFGQAIRAVIVEHGMAEFRRVERTLLRKLPKSQLVVSTGSGTAATLRTLVLLRLLGTTLWLKLDALSIFHRITRSAAQDVSRLYWPAPSEVASLNVDRVRAALRERSRYYRWANYSIDVGDGTSDEIVAKIVDLIHLPRQRKGRSL